MVLNKSAIRQKINNANIGTGYLEALEKKIEDDLKDHARREQLNGRKTVYPRDI